MEVTSQNFCEKLPLIRRAIENSLFVAIDTELTGLQTNRRNHYRLFDDVQARYDKFRASAHGFQVLQYGICPFSWNESRGGFEAWPINVYLFPRTSDNVRVAEQVFYCHASSIDFLVKHGFDFNKAIRQGVSFLSHEEEARIRANELGERDDVILSEADREFVDANLYAYCGTRIFHRSHYV